MHPARPPGQCVARWIPSQHPGGPIALRRPATWAPDPAILERPGRWPPPACHSVCTLPEVVTSGFGTTVRSAAQLSQPRSQSLPVVSVHGYRSMSFPLSAFGSSAGNGSLSFDSNSVQGGYGGVPDAWRGRRDFPAVSSSLAVCCTTTGSASLGNPPVSMEHPWPLLMVEARAGETGGGVLEEHAGPPAPPPQGPHPLRDASSPGLHHPRSALTRMQLPPILHPHATADMHGRVVEQLACAALPPPGATVNTVASNTTFPENFVRSMESGAAGEAGEPPRELPVVPMDAHLPKPSLPPPPPEAQGSDAYEWSVGRPYPYEMGEDIVGYLLGDDPDMGTLLSSDFFDKSRSGSGSGSGASGPAAARANGARPGGVRDGSQ